MQTLQENFLGTPTTLLFLVQPPTHPLHIFTYSPTHLSEMQRQEQELAGDIGKHSQSQRNYKQNLTEMTPELWSVSNCEELVGVSHRKKTCVRVVVHSHYLTSALCLEKN